MKIFKRRDDLGPYLKALKKKGKSIGFVPTMGALHKGHISLIEACQAKCDTTVCSIFVNPTQFNDPKDLKKYPRPLEKDIEMLIEADCDILYLPEMEDIYPDGTVSKTAFKPGYIGKILEGASRKGHFEGVMQVVSILLDITRPDCLFLGQKDYQQFLILTELVKQMRFKTKVVRCPIVREENGLAMSSRNVRLSPTLRKKAGVIYQTLQSVAARMGSEKPERITKEAVRNINTHKGFRVDYFKLLNAKTMKPVKSFVKNKNYILITSVIVGGVRLLDNLLIGKQIK